MLYLITNQIHILTYILLPNTMEVFLEIIIKMITKKGIKTYKKKKNRRKLKTHKFNMKLTIKMNLIIFLKKLLRRRRKISCLILITIRKEELVQDYLWTNLIQIKMASIMFQLIVFQTSTHLVHLKSRQ